MDPSLPYVLPLVSDAELRFQKYLNLLLALLARRERSRIVYSLPFSLTLDLSTYCQLSCPYCSVGNGTIRRTPGMFSPDLNRRILKELGEKVFIIWYFSTGEPLLNRQGAEIFKAAASFEIFTVISTNLSFQLSDERIDELLRSGLGAISVSLDGASPATYARYRVGGDFNLVVDNMARLVKRRGEMGLSLPLVEWRFLVFRHNEAEMQRAKAMAAELGVDILEFSPGYAPPNAQEPDVQLCTPGIQIVGPFGPALDKALRRRDTFLRRQISRGVFLPRLRRLAARFCSKAPPESLSQKKCDWLYFGTTIFPNGSVGPCCVSNDEPDDFGNLGSAGVFAGVWNNPRYRAARELFAGRAEPGLICDRCTLSDAQDYQFGNTLRALLRNAPDWVVLALSRGAEKFFWEIDTILLSEEIEALKGCLEA